MTEKPAAVQTVSGQLPVDFAFLDSGTGGLPYMLHLKRYSPASRCVYLADTRNFPYGTKTAAEVVRCAIDASSLIIRQFNPGAVIVACNTMSVIALEALRTRFPVPFIGTVPAIKMAAQLSKNRRIGLLATERTVEGAYTRALADRFAVDCTVFYRGDSALVSFVEHHLCDADAAQRRAAVRPAVNFFRDAGVDTIILGCTHFIHLFEEIRSEAGSGIAVIDSRDGVVRQALRVTAARQRERADPAVSGAGTGTADAGYPADQSLFVTGREPEAEYRLLAARLSIPWGGLL